MPDKNKVLLNDLNEMLDTALKNQIKQNQQDICEREFAHIRLVLNQAVKSFTFQKGPCIFIRKNDFFFDVLETLTMIFQDIEKDRSSKSKLALRETILQMITRIHTLRPDLNLMHDPNEAKRNPGTFEH